MEDRSGSITMEILLKLHEGSFEVPMAELAAVASWYIWWQRRQLVKDVAIQTPEKTALSMRVLATNFIRAMPYRVPNRKYDSMWKKPSNGVIKINVDTSFNGDTMSGASEAIARDNNGDFVAAPSWFCPHVRSVDSVELIAVRNGIFLAASLGCNSLEIESDNSFVVDTLNSTQEYLGPDVAIVSECQHMALEFGRISFKHCFREANQVADELAKNAFPNRSSSSWEVVIPDFISHLIVNDMSII
ncbi:Ketohexokinase [Hordeum vulgare]|nr:Ketohexokinase [Hordeum vulgare]